MNWSQQPATEGRLGSAERSGPIPSMHPAAASRGAGREDITIGKATTLVANGQEVEVFTMTLGGETISLLPLRNWSQQDVHKWRARGKLPGTPPGLEITFDHVKVAGESVSINELGGTLKLQKLLNDWLALERQSLVLAQQRAHPQKASTTQSGTGSATNLPPHFRVELDRDRQVHIRCLQGKEVLAIIGLNLPGLTNLVNQGLMHKPHKVQVGALHDWVELDGEFFSFEKGNDDSPKLEKVLNERYLSTAALGLGKEVVVFANVASPTGFDIQFAAKEGGVIQQRRRPLNEEALVLLQNPDKCVLLPKGVVIKLSPPNLIFKRKTPDGGEVYLARGPDQVVTVTDDDGEVKHIDLSQPVNYLRLTALDLTAVFNHPAVNQQGTLAPQSEAPAPVRVPPTMPEAKPAPAPLAPLEPVPPKDPVKPVVLKSPGAPPVVRQEPVVRPRPNLWLEPVLAHPAARPDWFAFLVYRKMAEHFGNSNEGYFGPHPCWVSSLGEVEDICDAAFRGVFLTQKGGLGYLNQGHLARFRNEVVFVGTLESTIEGIGVKLIAVGMDSQQRIVFVVNDGFRAAFGIPDQTVAEDLARLREYGACMVSPSEAMQSPEPFEVVWTVSADEEASPDPQAVVNLPPGHTDNFR